MPAVDPIDSWLDALIARHTASLTRPEFLKAVRALSARYVERRAELPARSPVDSAGKRAAFSAFFAPLHFFTVRAILRALETSPSPASIVDLGCGTGLAGAAWSLHHARAAPILGVDRHAWMLTEAAWNWRQLGIAGRTRRGDIVTAAEQLARVPARDARGRGVLLAWAANELDEPARSRLLAALQDIAAAESAVLVIEPLAARAVPWWREWVHTLGRRGRADEWKLPADVPPRLAELSDAAGFRREWLAARSLWVPGRR